jgi:hydroxyisourate hydrolase
MAAGKLSTHVLDTARGKPAAGVRVELYRVGAPGGAAPLVEAVTNADGRTPAPLLDGEDLTAGTYRLAFHVGDYFAAIGHGDAKRFLDVVPIVFVSMTRQRGTTCRCSCRRGVQHVSGS